MTIVTPAQYADLKSGQLAGDFDAITVRPTAHSDILSEPKHLSTEPYESIGFLDGHGNQITIYPAWKSALAIFNDGENLTLGLPQNYEAYHFLFGDGAYCTSDDLQYILQWQHAKSLAIHDNNDVAWRLLQRIDNTNEMVHLEQLFLSLNRETYKNIKFPVILERLPSLKLVQFFGDRLNRTEIQEFTALQTGLPNPWTVAVKENVVEIFFRIPKILAGHGSHRKQWPTPDKFYY